MKYLFKQLSFINYKKFTSLAILSIVHFICINSIIAQVNVAQHPMFMHDLKHTGRSSYEAANISKLKWSSITGNEIWSSPIVGPDNTIYITSTDGNIFALNSDGTEKWHYKTGSELFSTPSVGADGTIYVGSNNKKFFALKPDGKIKWVYFVGSDVFS